MVAMAIKTEAAAGADNNQPENSSDSSGKGDRGGGGDGGDGDGGSRDGGGRRRQRRQLSRRGDRKVETERIFIETVGRHSPTIKRQPK